MADKAIEPEESPEPDQIRTTGKQHPDPQAQPQSRLEISSMSWKGPIPPPSVIREYDEVVQNGAERLFAQFEKETAHRHKLESRKQTFPLIEQLAARAFALVFALACLAASVYFVQQGAYAAAAVVGGVMIVSGINAFLQRSASPKTPTPPVVTKKKR